MMKALIKLLFALGLFVLAAGLIVPGFIDWNQHKDKITTRLSAYFQRKIDVAGNVSLQLLPQPEIMLESVSVANAAGARAASLMTLAKLGIRIKFSPLLKGRIEVESIDLVEPVLNLEVLPGGKANWTGVLKEQSAGVLGGAAPDVKLNQVSVIRGIFNYTNPATGSKLKIEDLNLSIIADTLLGPYMVTGSMQYRGLPVKIEAGTEKYVSPTPVAIRVGFLPARNLPMVKFNGVADFQSDLDLQGELSVTQGDLASLLDIPALKDVHFLHDPVALRSVMEFKNSQFSMSDIKAKFGQKGELQGKISVQFSRERKPVVQMDIEGSNLTVTDKAGDIYLALPDGFSGSLRGKGKNIVWGGYRIGSVVVVTDFDSKEWKIKSSRIDLPGGGQLKLSGTVSPENDSGAYTIQLTTDDLTKTIRALQPAQSSIFKSLGDAGAVRKIALSSGLIISPARISFFNMDATVEDRMKLSGVINIDRMLQKPNFVAKLNFSDWDTSAVPPEVFDGFLQKMGQADADVELSFSNYTRNDLRMPEMALSGKINPSGIDLSYAVNIEQAGLAVESFLPPSLLSWNKANINGKVIGNSQTRSFTARGTVAGSTVMLTGVVSAGVYHGSLKVKDQNAEVALALLRLPVNGLAGDKGAVDMSGELNGTKDNYRIDKLRLTIGSADLSGTLERKDNKLTADLYSPKLDLDRWLSGVWMTAQNIVLRLHGDELIFQGTRVAAPQLTAEVVNASVHIADLSGTVWGGKLKADLSLTQQAQGGWSSVFKGSVKQADLSGLSGRLGLGSIFLPGMGDIDFNLTSPDNTPVTAAGSFAVKASSVKVDKFNFSKLGAEIDSMTAVPTALQQIVDHSLRQNGDTTFRDISGQFKVDKGKITIERLLLPDISGAVNVRGGVNAKTGSYNISAMIGLSQPSKFPEFKVQRSSDASDYMVDTAPIVKFIIKNNPPPLMVQPDVNPVPAPATALPPVPYSEEKGGLQDVLKRLDEEPPTPIPAKRQEDTNKELQNMLIREMMQEQSGVGALP